MDSKFDNDENIAREESEIVDAFEVEEQYSEYNDTVEDEEDQVYRSLVVDSGPIIRLTGLTTLRGRAKKYFTVPGVLDEIRDAKARDHLDQLPFDLITREASAEGIHAVTQFARQTGDYHSLSAVDLQVLGLLYDLEREGCEGIVDHIRKTPKRKIGLGKVEFLRGITSRNEGKKEIEDSRVPEKQGETEHEQQAGIQPVVHQLPAEKPIAPKTWSMIVNPSAASTTLPVVDTSSTFPTIKKSEDVGLKHVSAKLEVVDLGGQFSDAEESDDGSVVEESSDDDDDEYADPEKEISDEECDVYILDPEEVNARQHDLHGADSFVEQELRLDFPSLAASLHVPYEGERLEGDLDEHVENSLHPLSQEELEERKKQALQPISKSGKLYNSFRKYSDLIKPKVVVMSADRQEMDQLSFIDERIMEVSAEDTSDGKTVDDFRSRIMGGTGTSGQELEVEDDGEGWITCSSDIRKMKASGMTFLTRNGKGPSKDNVNPSMVVGPPISKRAACATTDFAIQNVILQMNLELLSVDGVKIRRLKSWVLRCGACFKIHAEGDSVGPLGTKRLFCSRCGSDMMQRIAASVDGKTGRLRLHLSNHYKNNLRGTKYSLPKPGTGNRFQGDLLLREDQLLSGAWNQKVKMMTGGQSRRAAQSMFGSDLASNVGCNASAVKADIKVGFGRRNPNAAKGRERRGKKEKSSDKACGLRRY